jgi:hypothetical protein
LNAWEEYALAREHEEAFDTRPPVAITPWGNTFHQKLRRDVMTRWNLIVLLLFLGILFSSGEARGQLSYAVGSCKDDVSFCYTKEEKDAWAKRKAQEKRKQELEQERERIATEAARERSESLRRERQAKRDALKAKSAASIQALNKNVSPGRAAYLGDARVEAIMAANKGMSREEAIIRSRPEIYRPPASPGFCNWPAKPCSGSSQ